MKRMCTIPGCNNRVIGNSKVCGQDCKEKFVKEAMSGNVGMIHAYTWDSCMVCGREFPRFPFGWKLKTCQRWYGDDISQQCQISINKRNVEKMKKENRMKDYCGPSGYYVDRRHCMPDGHNQCSKYGDCLDNSFTRCTGYDEPPDRLDPGTSSFFSHLWEAHIND